MTGWCLVAALAASGAAQTKGSAGAPVPALPALGALLLPGSVPLGSPLPAQGLDWQASPALALPTPAAAPALAVSAKPGSLAQSATAKAADRSLATAEARAERGRDSKEAAERSDADVASQRDYFDGSADAGLEAANGSAGPAVPAQPGGEGGGRKDGGALHRLSVDEQLEALFEKYEVPPADRPLRRRLTLEAVERIRADIPLFAREPRLKVGFGSWWLTLQDLADPRAKEIQIPIEDIFVRAVDERGVREAVGAAAHEVMHYSITRPDPDHPLTRKYALRRSPAANNLLYQHLEDARINSWGLRQVPGLKPYFDATYEALWPEDPSAAQALERGRVEALRRSTLRVPDAKGGERDWMPPHLQYVNSILYHWRHRKLPPYLTDPAAKAAFERTLPALERVRLTHPQALGGVILEEAKRRASSHALETIDREIFPEYQRLIAESERQLDRMEPKKGEPGDGKPGELPRELLDALDERVREVVERHGRKGEGSAHDHGALPTSPEDVPQGDAPVKDEPWSERRARAVDQRRSLEAGFTDYERYRRRAQELGLITQVDGMVKKLLLPTKHARLSRQVFHEGDEPDMNKYYDDLAQGRVDAPMMRRWNRRIKRSAKLALVLDISGSMGRLSEAMDSKLDQALIAIVAWIEVSQKNGLDFELLLFDDKPDPVHRFGAPIDKAEKDRILETIAKHPRGSTAIGTAFKAAVESLAKQPATHRFILFATDEDHNSGESPGQYAELARRHRIATVAMVIGADEAAYKHFDYRVSVKEAKDLPRELLGVLTRALRAMLGSAAGAYGVALALAPKAVELFSGFASMGFGDVAGEPRPAPGRPSVFSELRAYLEGVLGTPLPAAKERAWRTGLAKLLRQDPGKDLRVALVESLASAYDLDPPTRGAVRDALSGRFVIQDTLARTIDSVSFAGGSLYAVRQPFPKDEPRLYRFTGAGWQVVPNAPEGVRQVVDYRGHAHALADGGLWRLEGEAWRLAVRGGFSSAYAAGDGGRSLF